MAQEYKPGEIVPQSGIYTITHDPVHADMPHEVTVTKAAVSRPAGTARASRSNSRMRRSTSPRSIILKRRMRLRSNRFSFPAWRSR